MIIKVQEVKAGMIVIGPYRGHYSLPVTYVEPLGGVFEGWFKLKFNLSIDGIHSQMFPGYLEVEILDAKFATIL
jgi:hypothetical protein